MLRFLWTSTRGYRLRPWASPYLRWRIETYWGLHAEELSSRDVMRFMWTHRFELRRFLRWSDAMRG
jgi:hypothetical protein